MVTLESLPSRSLIGIGVVLVGNKSNLDSKWKWYTSGFTYDDGEERHPGKISGFTDKLSTSTIRLYCAWVFHQLEAGSHLKDLLLSVQLHLKL